MEMHWQIKCIGVEYGSFGQNNNEKYSLFCHLEICILLINGATMEMMMEKLLRIYLLRNMDQEQLIGSKIWSIWIMFMDLEK